MLHHLPSHSTAALALIALLVALLASASGCTVVPERISYDTHPVTCAVTGTATICTQSWVMANHTGQVVRPVVIQ